VQDVENDSDDDAVRPADNDAVLSPRPDTFDSADAAAAPSRRGNIRTQEPGITRPRPPTLAEARARDKAQKAREEAERFAEEQAATAERRRRQSRKTLMGAVAVVGVVGVVAMGYQMSKRDPEVAASCVDENNVVVPDDYCGRGTPGMGGIFIWAGMPYRYYYGGSTGGVGTRATGGTLTQPSRTTARTKSGSTITRGGFGSSSGGSLGG